ncbi:MAG TPA: aldo/keto reductase, partial [Hyphomicrobiales bacterium]|nr:aldo/keto reductase [Hyphomicrobiales bacterium]
GRLTDPKAQLEAADIRHHMPRFHPDNYARNLQLLESYQAIADEAGCTMAQLALAWLLHRAPHIIPIPGTRHVAYAEENIGALDVELTQEQMARLDRLINTETVVGERYNAATQQEIDTEQF